MSTLLKARKILSRFSRPSHHARIIVIALGMVMAISAQAREIDYKALYEQTAPAVVMLYGTAGQVGSSGTGSIIDGSGLVLTNAHVAFRDYQKKTQWDNLYIYLKPEKVTGNPRNDLQRAYRGKVLVAHPQYDLALVQIINPPRHLPVLALSTLENVAIGEPTVAIGHPGGGAKWTLTTGRLSASWESFNNVPGRDVFQTEASLNPGNSGGPLLDGSSAIIGINTFIVRESKDGTALTGLNYAVKSTTARKWILSVNGRLPLASTVTETTPPAVAAVPPRRSETTPSRRAEPTAPSSHVPSGQAHSNQTPASPAPSRPVVRPDPTKVAKAPPPVFKPKQPRVEGSESQFFYTDEELKDNRQDRRTRRSETGGRTLSLASPPIKRERYQSNRRSGEQYQETELDKLRKRAADAFDELDREVEALEYGEW